MKKTRETPRHEIVPAVVTGALKTPVNSVTITWKAP